MQTVLQAPPRVNFNPLGGPGTGGKRAKAQSGKVTLEQLTVPSRPRDLRLGYKARVLDLEKMHKKSKLNL